ncbi:MAG: UDP-3-O-(3-hydroxymyristoyl)glucosamine N-acyltransferase [Bacteroidales bacterium]|jgi:UDP-3-O-[3-hydroxymyristoyl] glucosamine N-acyltransferase|nr:UDP-3-O-(3-hydroxymyristoyl)glucosamine N-acyltransferase [Bacteroidales bacterium]
MKFTVKEIAAVIGGKVEGNPEAIVDKFSKIESGEEGGLSFLANPKYTHYLYTTKATAVLISSDFELTQPVKCTLIRTADPYLSFAKLMTFYNQKIAKTGISDFAAIAKNVKIGKNVYIADFVSIADGVEIGDNVQIFPHAYIGENVHIGNNTLINAGVKIHSDCIIGNDCTLHAGCIIGADGFGFAPQKDNQYVKIPQLGNVVIEDNVDIGANTCIDRSTLGSTIIRKGVKLCNFIQIAHNCEIGENTVMAAQCGVSGSTKIGKNCIFGGQVGVNWHLTIGDNVQVGAQSAISNNVKDNAVMLGTPAFNASDCIKSYAMFKFFPKYVERIEELEREVKKLKEQKHK